MHQLYSTGCMYTLRALMHVGKNADRNPFTAKAICRKADIPESFTRKIFQALRRGGFLTAVSGPRGGYRLARHPRAIAILDVIHAVDGLDSFDQCVLNFKDCGTQKHCALHSTWKKAKKKLLQELQDKTVQDLIGTVCREKGKESS